MIKIIEELESLKHKKGQPNTRTRYRELKKQLLEYMDEDTVSIGGYVLVKGYQAKNKQKPYVQIYTDDSWERRERFLKENKII